MVNLIMWVSQNGFRDEELFEPLEYFTSIGYDVNVVAHKAGKAISKFGKEIVVSSLDEADMDAADGFLLVGGPGTYDYVKDEKLHGYIRKAMDLKILVGAICFSPNILAKSGIMRGKRAAVSSDVEMSKEGAICTGNNVEIDGEIITGDGPAAALSWAKAIENYFGR